jgi:hypothetical protein
VAVSAWHAPYGFAPCWSCRTSPSGSPSCSGGARPEEASASAVRGALLLAAALQGAVAVAQAFSGQPRPAGSFLNPNPPRGLGGRGPPGELPPLIAQGGRAASWRSRWPFRRWGPSRPAARGGEPRAPSPAWPCSSSFAGRRFRGRRGASRWEGRSWPHSWRGGRRLAPEGGRSLPLDPHDGSGRRHSRWPAARRGWLRPGPVLRRRRASASRTPWDRSGGSAASPRPHSDLLRLPAEFGIPAAWRRSCSWPPGLPAALRRARAGDGLAQASALAGLAAPRRAGGRWTT